MVLRLGIERSFLKLALSFSLRIQAPFPIYGTVEAKPEGVVTFLGGNKREPANSAAENERATSSVPHAAVSLSQLQKQNA